jgi:small subunit ribosomal protein S8
MTDPVADMLTRIRNAVQAKKPKVDILMSKLNQEIADALKREMFIRDYRVVKRSEGHPVLRLYLRYTKDNQSIITEIHRVSTPGRRYYVDSKHIPRVKGNLGTAILTTSQGILSSKESRRLGVGGEVICYVW